MSRCIFYLVCIPLVLCIFHSVVYSSCPASQVAGSSVQLIFTTPMKIVTNDTLQDCDKSVDYISMARLGIEEVSENAFSDFYNLEILTLADNNISVLPPHLLDYKRGLTYFMIENNHIERIEDETFKDLENVRFINLQCNNISYIGPNAFPGNLQVLESVNLSYNSLTYFEPWPFIPETNPDDGLDVLFDFRHNFISEFRNSINWTYDLIQPFEYEIILSHNEITSLNDSLVYLYNPNYQGSAFPEFLTYKMNLSENPFVCDCKVYPFANYLHDSVFYFFKMDEFRYRCLKPDSLNGTDFLHDVALKDFVCNIEEDCPPGCMCEEQPSNGYLLVNCSFTNDRMSELPVTLPTTESGKISLHLDGHYIRSLEQRSYIGQLVNLTISYNKLTFIDSSVLKSMSNINHLDISHNHLKYVSKDIQYITMDKIRISSNRFECDCNMTWMADWINLSPNAHDYEVQCVHDDSRHRIREITREKLLCNYEYIIIIVVVVLGVLIAIIIGAVITARRCPYETKVLLYRLFGVHPADKYRVDVDEPREYDIYISHYEHDIQARQWVRSKFLRKLEETQKRRYKIFYSERDLNFGGDMFDDLVTNMKKSRRIIFILTREFFEDDKNIFETDQAEMEHRSSDNLHGRVIYILWNESIREKLNSDPWKTRVEGKRVLCPDDKLFWSKMRYELPLKPVP